MKREADLQIKSSESDRLLMVVLQCDDEKTVSRQLKGGRGRTGSGQELVG